MDGAATQSLSFDDCAMNRTACDDAVSALRVAFISLDSKDKTSEKLERCDETIEYCDCLFSIQADSSKKRLNTMYILQI